AVRQALVPVRRWPEQGPRVAGAERADDHVVHGLRVLDGDDDGRRPGVEAELQRGGAGIREQPDLELRIDPGPRDEPGSVGRRPGDQPVDPPADVLAGDDPLLDEQLLERRGPCGGGGLVAVRDRVVVVIVVVVGHAASSGRYRTDPDATEAAGPG